MKDSIALPVVYSSFETMTSEAFMKELDPNRFDKINYFGLVERGQVYGSDFHGSKIKKCHFTRCEFNDVSFTGTSGSSSSFKECVLNNCHIRNANFDFADFQGSRFLNDTNVPNIVSTGFNHSNFSHAAWEGVRFSGCSFDSGRFENTHVRDSECTNCNFENVHFENAVFENIDLSKASLDFSTMNNVTFNNVVLQLPGILHAYRGLENVERYGRNVSFKFPDSKVVISFSKLLENLEKMQPFFCRVNDFFVPANIQIFRGNNEQALEFIRSGVIHSLQFMDFRMIGYYCKLASLHYTFKNESLRQLYEMLQSDEIIEKMTPHEYQTYLFEMDRIKRLLIDRPFGQAQLKVSIETDITFNEVDDSKIVSTLFGTVHEAAPQSNHHLEVRHNSPYWFDLLISGSHTDLFTYCGYFFGGFMLLTTIASTYQKLVNQHYVNKIKKIEAKEKEVDFDTKRKRNRLERDDFITALLLKERKDAVSPIADRIVGVTVTFVTAQDVPKGLRKFTLRKGNP